MSADIIKSSGTRHFRVIYNSPDVEKKQFERVFRKKNDAISFAFSIINSIYELVGMQEEVVYDYIFKEKIN